MKNNHEVLRMRRARSNGKTQEQAAAHASMSVRTARKYERLGQLPSQLSQPRAYCTRPNPFATDWPWICAQLERDSALQAKTLFAELNEQEPGRYQPNQLRTLQRHVATWRAEFGPAREVIFEQVHQPGILGQSDFTHMEELQVTLAGVPFAHLVYHFVLTYSNIEAIQICFSESFESLAEGLESCLWQVGGMPQQHRTDNLSAAVVKIAAGERVYTERYRDLMAHYHMQPSTNQPGVAHENGDVEQSHYRFKEVVDQALRLRGSRDFADRAAYTRWGKAEQTEAVVHELEEQGVLLHELAEQVGKEFDPFDLVCHVAFDRPPLTRRQRAELVRKGDYFAKYGEQARAVLDTLLEKYADAGIAPVESLDVLKIQPFDRLGSPVELIRQFGGKPAYLQAVRELRELLYTAA